MGWDALTASDEVNVADWIRDRLHPFAQDVGSIVPAGFDAYSRIFHPAWRSGDETQIEVRWSDVAAWSGKTVHAEMQFHSIAVPLPARQTGSHPWSGEPRLGVLSPQQAAALIGLLAKHTSTPERCWFCLWEGYGYLTGSMAGLVAHFWKEGDPGRPVPSRAAIRPPRPKLKKSRVRLPGRDYLLFTGSVTQGEGWEDGPNIWWPEDRSWLVASEIDLPYTYVGGSSKLIEAILAHPLLEALPATIDQGITADSDAVNS
jgi:hypothetical protein